MLFKNNEKQQNKRNAQYPLRIKYVVFFPAVQRKKTKK